MKRGGFFWLIGQICAVVGLALFKVVHVVFSSVWQNLVAVRTNLERELAELRDRDSEEF